MSAFKNAAPKGSVSSKLKGHRTALDRLLERKSYKFSKHHGEMEFTFTSAIDVNALLMKCGLTLESLALYTVPGARLSDDVIDRVARFKRELIESSISTYLDIKSGETYSIQPSQKADVYASLDVATRNEMLFEIMHHHFMNWARVNHTVLSQIKTQIEAAIAQHANEVAVAQRTSVVGSEDVAHTE